MEAPSRPWMLGCKDAPFELLNAVFNLLGDRQVRIDDRVSQRVQQRSNTVVQRTEVGVQPFGKCFDAADWRVVHGNQVVPPQENVQILLQQLSGSLLGDAAKE